MVQVNGVPIGDTLLRQWLAQFKLAPDADYGPPSKLVKIANPRRLTRALRRARLLAVKAREC